MKLLGGAVIDGLGDDKILVFLGVNADIPLILTFLVSIIKE